MDLIFPPRPASRMMPNELRHYEKTGKWVAQRKFNGTRSVVHIIDEKVEIFGRLGEPHKQFVPPKQLMSDISGLNFEPGLEYWLDGEVMDGKTTNPMYKDKLIIFDVLFAGKLLFGKPTLMDRLQMLSTICRNPTEIEPNGIALKITPNLWMAETFTSDFPVHYKEIIDRDEIEGLMLKQMESVIDNFGNKYYETSWLIRCRKPHQSGSYAY